MKSHTTKTQNSLQKVLTVLFTSLFATSILIGCNGSSTSPTASSTPVQTGDIHKIKHIVVIMQENRSFDTYFGTYPGADGIPMKNGVPTVCVPDPKTNQCLKPYHNPDDLNHGGPHGQIDATNDIDGGKMDGFIAQTEHAKKGCKDPNNPACTIGGNIDVMGYHDAREIPNYWTYAQNFVLQDHMFEPNASWSLPAHLFMVSAWSASCSRRGDPMSCQSNINRPGGTKQQQNTADYAWTDLTYLLYKAKVSWAYYVFTGIHYLTLIR